MGSLDSYSEYDGVGLAELVRRGDVSAAEVCEEAIRRIETLNPKLNAVVTPLFEFGRKSASRQNTGGRFRGVPFLLKDLVEVLGGARLTMGSRAFKDFTPASDSEMVSRFKREGLVILGKTNVPEFGLAGVTESRFLGPCRNPWNVEYTPGGSSGGSAAAVASGMVPIASANDGGGSIRIPASCCGLFGLKPSRGRTPVGPFVGELWQGAALSHVLTRTVRDSASMLDATGGPEPGSPYSIERPTRPYSDLVDVDPDRLRIAFSTQSPLGTSVHEDCRVAVENTARLLEELGHTVEDDAPDIDGPRLIRSFLAMVFAETAADLEQAGFALGGRLTPRDVEPVTWAIGALGKALSGCDLSLARRFWGVACREMGRFHSRYDLYLTPTMAYPPSRIGELQPSRLEELVISTLNRLRLVACVKRLGVLDSLADRMLARNPFTPLANLTGQPAVSVPLHWTEDGLPCGVQFVAALGNEAVLFQLAGQLERARPWTSRRPPVWAQ